VKVKDIYNTNNWYDVILLDDESTLSLSCNKAVAAYAGELKTSIRAAVPAYGPVWYHQTTITNKFSFAEMECKHPMKYNLTAEHSLVVQ
jgi:hypothetical protein